MSRRRPRPPVPLLVLGLVTCAAACTTGGAPGASPTATATATVTVTPTPAPTATTTSAAPTATPVGTPSPEPTPPVPPAPTQESRADVDVTLTFVTWNGTTAAVEVGSYVAGVVENGGTCTLRLERDGNVVTAASDALADAASTSCGILAVAGSALTGGTWSASVEYTSATSTGTSEAMEVAVP